MVDRPADAYLCLRLAELADRPVELVIREYKANKGRGWGVIAKRLGIKPGSREFHALKENTLDRGLDDHGKGKSKKKDDDGGKGKGKGKGYDK
ncbi:MAG: hypothetical protein K8I29_20015 [Alphaproteobacteria bacterium]|uniref:Uncharacterized protein n=1 Tax=Candidatus Nitrobium versatile TaxID=2884831 RepID=A0A953M3W5_9BACT|nr:hypothetical protein [Candidatus Nitrobium versatile]